MQIGETINGNIVTKLNGVLTNADALPVAEIYIDGSTASTATVTALAVGEYQYEFVTAGTVGQDVSVRVTGVIDNESFVDWDYYGQLVSVPVTSEQVSAQVWADLPETIALETDVTASQNIILSEINDGVTLTAAERTAVATAVETALLNEGDGQQLLQAIVDTIEAQTDLENLTLTAIKDAVWNAPLTSYSTAGTAGKKLVDQLNAPSQVLSDYKANITGLSTLTEAQINAQVDTALTEYDAPTRAEATADKNEILSATPSLDLPAIADAVWDEGLSAHIVVGSAGKKLGDQLNAPSQVLSDYHADVSAIPTNPLLTNDVRLVNLDAAISTRATPADIAASTTAVLASQASGVALTSAERIAVAAAVEGAILNETDGQQVLNAIVAAIGNQNIDEIALVAAIRADIERAGGALKGIPVNPVLETDVRLDNLDAAISGIPTNPLLDNDVRLDHLDADISGIGGGSQQIHVGCDVDVTVEDDLIEAEVLCKT